MPATISTIAGRVVGDDGHGRLAAALDEAHEVADHVVVSIAGPNARTYQSFTGDHVERDGSVHFGSIADDAVVLPSSRTPAGHAVDYRGGYAMADGRRVERFRIGAVAMTVSWTPAADLAPAGSEPAAQDLVDRLRIRADIRRSAAGRRSVAEGTEDRLANLLDEAADEIARLRAAS